MKTWTQRLLWRKDEFISTIQSSAKATAVYEIVNDKSLLHVSTTDVKKKSNQERNRWHYQPAEEKGVLCLPYRPGFFSGSTQATKSNIMTLKGRSVVIQLLKVHHFLILDNKDTAVYNLMLLKKRGKILL